MARKDTHGRTPAPAAAGDDPRIDRSVDRYRIEGVLGRGGFGTVYRAKHHVLGRPVALKVLHGDAASDATIVERFLREAKAASAIGSPHIVEVYDAGSADGEVFLAMELLEGEDLAHRIAARAPMPEEQAIAIGLEILDALAAAHAAGIVHRDLKPANVFLARGPDGRERVKLLDFGISKIASAHRLADRSASSLGAPLTRSGEVLGTPLYMAPEQLNSAAETDARADLWSWGAILFEMLSGRTPYEARTFEELVVKRLSEPPRSIDELAPRASASLRRLIGDTLALDPGERPPSAQVIARGLRGFPSTIARGIPKTIERPPATRAVPVIGADAPTAPAPPRSARPSALRYLPAFLAFALPVAIAATCLVAIAIGLLVHRFRSPRPATNATIEDVAPP